MFVHFPIRHFEIPPATEASRLFSVLDFIGDACKTLASRIRGAVAAVTFDDFHKVSCIILLAFPPSIQLL